MLVVVRSDQRHQVRNRHASQGDVNAPTLPLLGRQPSKESKSLGGQRSYGIKWLRGPATTDIKDTQLRGRFDLNPLRGPATTEIDSPTFEVDVVLNRRGFLILSKSPSADVNAWEFTGNQCGNRVGIWERDRNSLRVMTSGGAVAPSVSPVPMT